MSKIRIKIFVGLELEKQINDFLEEENVVYVDLKSSVTDDKFRNCAIFMIPMNERIVSNRTFE